MQTTTSTASDRARIFLAGNPNSGKTTLFNRLTGLRQHTGNYPGVTVEKKSGDATLSGRPVEIIDLPGTYSLSAASPDEHVAVEALTGQLAGRPSLVVCVVDASNLQRHLFLVSQILDFGVPVVIALNMIDVARKKGIDVDARLLEQRIGCPVVPVQANTGEGWSELLAAMGGAIETPAIPDAREWPPAVTEAANFLRGEAARQIGRLPSMAEGLRLLFDQSPVGAERMGWTSPDRDAAREHSRESLRSAGLNPSSSEAVLRYASLREILDGAVGHGEARGADWSSRIDAVLTHRFAGLAVFAGIMYFVFLSIYSWAGPLMDAVEGAVGLLGDWVSPRLEATPMLQSLLVDGVIGGVGGVLVFLPQILILFAFITLLEDSGYMARAAFLMDRIFGWCGLNGRSFVPMLSSYACAIPGIMSTRVIPDPRARLLTILISPLMSCSARLPVYTLMIGAFIEPKFGAAWAAFALFAMHVLGLAVAIPAAYVINRTLLKIPAQPFVLEIPPYRRPTLRNILFRLWEAGRAFVVRAGSIIMGISIIIWALLYFPRPESVAEQAAAAFVEEAAAREGIDKEAAVSLIEEDEALGAAMQNQIDGAYIEQSLLARAGKWMQPAFAPAGFDWKITVGILASFPAREVIVSTLGIIYSLGADVDDSSSDLRSSLASEVWSSGPLAGTPIFTPAVAIAIMVFFALCMQCGATLAIMARETNWRWAVFAFAYMTLLAWLGAVLTYQILSRILPT